MRALTATTFALLAVLVSPVAAEDDARREHGPHVHGEGRLGIVLDGKQLQLELEAPAADIVGFEHAASTDADREAVRTAAATLEKADTVFVLPAEAGCKLDAASVEAEGALAPPDPGAKPEAKHEDGGHSELHAVYTLTCTAPEKLASITFPYFKTFSRAERLDVTVVGPKSQTQADATRDNPTLDLTRSF
ncbi:MAG: DUF2796 domain-containing protein [Proteobacteria bacterium]|nr:DUF2796 domain-containing protein [Pseudomonadota bacterium]